MVLTLRSLWACATDNVWEGALLAASTADKSRRIATHIVRPGITFGTFRGYNPFIYICKYAIICRDTGKRFRWPGPKPWALTRFTLSTTPIVGSLVANVLSDADATSTVINACGVDTTWHVY